MEEAEAKKVLKRKPPMNIRRCGKCAAEAGFMETFPHARWCPNKELK